MDAKKLIAVVVIVFVGFWMFTDPNGLAEMTKTGAVAAWDLIQQLFTGLIDFINALG
ncbi:hypothetical protein [Nocardioides sp. GY 10113]|uniref:hypothetical protein n=1 Tax=Nocardioides sp. GY 10113 TaxID=2569761 RepID=UPI001458A90C|nr:hypothetical protein [Nocardioides sp. GY 10113]